MPIFMRRKAVIEKIIVGLGNPGAQYVKTRHNSGFNAVDYIAGRAGIKVDRLKHYAKTGRGTIDGHSVLLLKPQTYMNDSGKAVADAMRFYKLGAESIIVISDDISLDVGRMRIRTSGSDGGQKGLRSIIEHIGNDGFTRIKIGVGAKPDPEYELSDWVLSDFSLKEKNLITEKYDSMYKAIELLLEGKADKAMQLLN